MQMDASLAFPLTDASEIQVLKTLNLVPTESDYGKMSKFAAKIQQ